MPENQQYDPTASDSHLPFEDGYTSPSTESETGSSDKKKNTFLRWLRPSPRDESQSTPKRKIGFGEVFRAAMGGDIDDPVDREPQNPDTEDHMPSVESLTQDLDGHTSNPTENVNEPGSFFEPPEETEEKFGDPEADTDRLNAVEFSDYDQRAEIEKKYGITKEVGFPTSNSEDIAEEVLQGNLREFDRENTKLTYPSNPDSVNNFQELSDNLLQENFMETEGLPLNAEQRAEADQRVKDKGMADSSRNPDEVFGIDHPWRRRWNSFWKALGYGVPDRPAPEPVRIEKPIEPRISSKDFSNNGEKLPGGMVMKEDEYRAQGKVVSLK